MNDPQNRTEAVEMMLQGFVQKPSEARVEIYVKRTLEYAEDVVKTGCTRLLDSCDRAPSVARLREACNDVRRELQERRQEPLPEGCQRDWLDQLFADGHLRKTKDGGVERVWIPDEHRPGWRLWAESALRAGWSESECADYICGALPEGWQPRNLALRREQVQRALSKRTIRIAGEDYTEQDLREAVDDPRRDGIQELF